MKTRCSTGQEEKIGPGAGVGFFRNKFDRVSSLKERSEISPIGLYTLSEKICTSYCDVVVFQSLIRV